MATSDKKDAVGSTKVLDRNEGGRTFDVTLNEFCSRLSGSDNRVELISAFHADEKRNGRVKDAESNFADRFLAFSTRPVKD